MAKCIKEGTIKYIYWKLSYECSHSADSFLVTPQVIAGPCPDLAHEDTLALSSHSESRVKKLKGTKKGLETSSAVTFAV